LNTRVLVWASSVVLCACGPLQLSSAGPSSDSDQPQESGALLGNYGQYADLGSQTTPSVRIDDPAPGSVSSGGTIIVKGSAADQRGISAVAVRVGPNQPIYAASTDSMRTWMVELSVPQYDFEVSAVAYALSGQSSPPASVLVTRVNAPADGETPSLTIVSPKDGSTPDQLLALVEGTTSDDRGVVSMTLARNDELLTEREVSTSDFFAHWSRLVPLLAGEANVLTFTATDASGHQVSSHITLFGKATTDRTPPTLIVRNPTEGSTVTTENIPVEGSAQATTGVRDVRVRLGYTTADSDTLVYTEYENAKTADGYANFQASLPARRAHAGSGRHQSQRHYYARRLSIQPRLRLRLVG